MEKQGISFLGIIGIMGIFAGIFLIVQGDWVIGICGSTASAGITYLSYRNPKKTE